ncbi:hypothetical protein EDD22DRAFT_959342 [Suillus occidentalis]|nr:hypothetical protein EDD22DRAFT_959342 [Suillus occidentalis]
MGNSSPWATRPPFRRWAHLALFTIALVSIVFFHSSTFISSALPQSSPQEIAHRSQILSECAYIHAKPGPPPNFHVRTQSDRYADSGNTTSVLVRNATIWTAADNGHEILTGNLLMHRDGVVDIVDLEGGTIIPGLTSFVAPLGLVEIRLEPSTNDGRVHNPLDGDLPAVLGKTIMRAQDGLMFGGQNLLLAYRGGDTTAITAPSGAFLRGVSTAFSPGAAHARVENASVVDEVALHVAVSMSSKVGVSTQVAALRNMLFGEGGDKVLRCVRKGITTLVVDVESAELWRRYFGSRMRATEAHLLAHEIAKAGVSVIVTESKRFSSTWEQRRILSGPPITQESLVTALLKAGVNVAIGVVDEYNARNTRFGVGWSLLTSNGYLDRTMALALATTNLEKALGVPRERPQDLVAYLGGDVFEFEAKVVGVISETLGRTDLFE